MNLLTAEAAALAKAVREAMAPVDGVEVVVCPAFTALEAVGEALDGGPVALGAQDCYTRESGAFTGAVSPQMLRDVGCAWTIVGHSERRRLFNETDALLNEKLRFALASGLRVMYCIGEVLEEREGGQMDEVLRRQILGGFAGLDEGAFEGVVVAYEPVWAIGTGLTATPDQAEEAHGFVRAVIGAEFGETVAGALRIQYGGSVKPENAADLMSQGNVDGALVGGASLDAESFAAIVRAAA